MLFEPWIVAGMVEAGTPRSPAASNDVIYGRRTDSTSDTSAFIAFVDRRQYHPFPPLFRDPPMITRLLSWPKGTDVPEAL